MKNTINIEQLQLNFPSLQGENATDMPCLLVAADEMLPLVTHLKNHHNYSYLADITAVDLIDEKQMEIIYHLMTVPEAEILRIKVRVGREQPQVPTLTALWPAANVQEREVFDLMGVNFSCHPNLERILCPDDFVGHPLRKDFQLKKPERWG